MSEFVEWAIKNVFQPGRLATVLVIIFLLMFMGTLPSPMLSAVETTTREHQGMGRVLTQICINTARTEQAVQRCLDLGWLP